MMALMLTVFGGCTNTDKNQDTMIEITEGKSNTILADLNSAKENTTANAQETAESNDPKAEDISKEDSLTEKESTKDTTELKGGIKDMYTQYDIKAGTCLSDMMIVDSKFTDIITANFNQITLENLMKPDYILSKSKSMAAGELTVEFTKKTRDLLDWAKNNQMSIRGHVLVWYSQTPDWIFYDGFDKANGLVDRDTMLARMESYIKQVFDQLDSLGYLDIFYAYDVVNEAIMEDGSYRDCLWKQVIGDDYIWYAFSYANKYAPENIKLYYNDYNEQFKTQHIVKLAQSLVAEDGSSLIDGIGCQGHLYTQDSISDYMATLEAFSTLGLDVQITELDVSLGTWQNILSATEENLRAQGQFYYELVSKIVEGNTKGTTKLSGITFWGFSDRLSWRSDRSPVLFNRNLEPKYSYYGARLNYDKAGY